MTLNKDKCYEYIGVFSFFEGGDQLKQKISVPEAGSLKLGCHHGQVLASSHCIFIWRTTEERRQALSTLFL